MKQNIQISIPKPCHEGWQNMTPVEKGRFCASCQKTVLDFTYLSDNEIIKLVKNNDNLCGRINTSQLNRNLIETKRTSNYFGYFATSVLAFLGIGTVSSFAQEKPVLEQTGNKYQYKPIVEQNIIKKTEILDDYFVVRGIVKDSTGKGIITFVNPKGQKGVLTNKNGEFEICVKNNQKVVFYNDDFDDFECKISDDSYLEIILDIPLIRVVTTGVVVVYESRSTINNKRTFFGRTFRKIGNWFR